MSTPVRRMHALFGRNDNTNSDSNSAPLLDNTAKSDEEEQNSSQDVLTVKTIRYPSHAIDSPIVTVDTSENRCEKPRAVGTCCISTIVFLIVLGALNAAHSNGTIDDTESYIGVALGGIGSIGCCILCYKGCDDEVDPSILPANTQSDTRPTDSLLTP